MKTMKVEDKKDPPKDEKRVEVDLDQPCFPLYNLLDIDTNRVSLVIIGMIRIYMCLFMSSNYLYPDEYWQGTEVAYNIVYGGVELPWEWRPQYRIRNVLYPYYLSVPLFTAKILGIDSREVVIKAPYLAHSILVIVGDYFMFKLAKKICGTQTARVVFLLYLSNAFFNSYLIRCFGNSVETFLNLIALYYYLDITKKYDRSLQYCAFALSLAFGIRNTALIGWIPLLLFKMIH
jgi:hypothetical protein